MDILSLPTASYEQCEEWAISKHASEIYMDILPWLYNISIDYGVNPVITIAQCAKETGYCKFGGVLDASFKNPCGLKSPRGGGDYDPDAHTRFSSWEEGVTAQVQHLCLYAGQESFPIANAVDPRHFPYLLGRCKTVESLSGNWAGAGYGESLVKMCREIEAIQIEMPEPEYYEEIQSEEETLNKGFEIFLEPGTTFTDAEKLALIKKIINS